MVTGALHLSEAFPWAAPRPSSWFVLGPYTTVLASVAFFAFDALAVRLGAGRRRRWLLAAVEVVVAWPVLALWGHPEDLLALGLAVYALLDARRRPGRAGWLLGAALAVQPLTVVLVPF